jgi:hypothetical protein
MARGKAQAAITLAKGFLRCQAGFESYAVLFSESSLEVPYMTGSDDSNRPRPIYRLPDSTRPARQNNHEICKTGFPRSTQSDFLQKMKATVLFRNLH